jgi:hypothetical protein
VVKFHQTLPQISPSGFRLSRFPAYETGGSEVGGYGCLVDDGLGGDIGEIDGGGFVEILGSGSAAKYGTRDGEDAFHMDWEGLVRLYGAGDLNELG